MNWQTQTETLEVHTWTCKLNPVVCPELPIGTNFRVIVPDSIVVFDTDDPANGRVPLIYVSGETYTYKRYKPRGYETYTFERVWRGGWVELQGQPIELPAHVAQMADDALAALESSREVSSPIL